MTARIAVSRLTPAYSGERVECRIRGIALALIYKIGELKKDKLARVGQFGVRALIDHPAAEAAIFIDIHPVALAVWLGRWYIFPFSKRGSLR